MGKGKEEKLRGEKSRFKNNRDGEEYQIEGNFKHPRINGMRISIRLGHEG